MNQCKLKDFRDCSGDLDAMIARLVMAGLTIGMVADVCGLSYFMVYTRLRRMEAEMNQNGFVRRVVMGQEHCFELHLPRASGRKLPKNLRAETRRLLLETNLSPTEIKKTIGVTSRYIVYHEKESLELEAVKGLGTFQPKRENRVCSVHGPVAYWPCVACEAIKASEARRVAGHARG